MSTPASGHAEFRRRLDLIIEREHVPDPERCVAAIIALLTHRSPGEHQDEPTDPAADIEAASVAAPTASGRRSQG